MCRAGGSLRLSVRMLVLAALSIATLAISASTASAGPGYALDPVKPSIDLGAEVPHGIAIDQASQAIYVTELTTDFFNVGHGQIEQFTSSGVPTANSPFVTGGEDLFAGVAVNPVTQGIYAYQTQVSTPFGVKGGSQMNTFSSTGVLGASFSPVKSTAPHLAADSSGRVYLPNDGTGTIQVFDSSGTLQDSIACTGCPGGAFSKPMGAAFDSAGNLYVVDIAGEGRAMKFEPSSGSFVYDSMVQSGGGAVAIGVDPASGDVFVGSLTDGVFHIVAYDSTGVQFDDFGGGTLGGPKAGPESAGQIAVNATTHKVYVTDPTNDKVWIFNRVASIPAPTASTSPASPIGQVEATLRASVDPNDHGLTKCDFEWTDEADFDLNGFANANVDPCPFRPYGSTSTPITMPIENLEPDAGYVFRVAVATNGGTAMGSAQEFETLPPLAPSVTTGSASSITKSSATLGGSVNPHGGPISDCHFEYIDEAGFLEDGFTDADTEECFFTPEGTASNPVSTKVVGLTPGTEYRFRVVATNNSGTTEAGEQTFTTVAETCETNPALCPPPPEEEKPTPPATIPPVSTPPTTTPSKPLKCRKGFKKKRVGGKLKCVKAKKKRKRR